MALAAEHLRGILDHAVQHDLRQAALVIADGQSELARVLAAAYARCLPEARSIDFEGTEAAAILELFDRLDPGSLVVLVQSTSFRLDAFRIRIELFNRGLKVIEHPHLARMSGPEALIYIDALAYDPAYFRGVGHALKERLDRAQVGVVESGGERLVFPAAFEAAKLNIGDYTGMKNVGGQFPIGEVFTESRDLEAVTGRVRIGFFGDTSFTVNRPAQAITLVVEAGLVVRTENSTPDFDSVLADIRADEGQIWLRELGFGMNRAFSQERTVSDIGSFERMCGVHLSLGAKHAVFNKPNIRKKKARYHVDVFVLTERVLLDGDVIYCEGAWQV